MWVKIKVIIRDGYWGAVLNWYQGRNIDELLDKRCCCWFLIQHSGAAFFFSFSKALAELLLQPLSGSREHTVQSLSWQDFSITSRGTITGKTSRKSQRCRQVCCQRFVALQLEWVCSDANSTSRQLLGSLAFVRVVPTTRDHFFMLIIIICTLRTQPQHL